MKSMSERAYWLAWQKIEGVGPYRLQSLLETFGSLEVAWHAQAPELRICAGLGSQLVEKITQQRRALDPLAIAATWEEKYGPCWTPADEAYPALLQQMADTPPVLYHRGAKPSAYGLRWAHKLGYELTRAGFLVASGLASGIDGAAHRGALEAGGQTVAVLGCGVDVCYPSEHHSLYRQIRDRGVILSEYPQLTPPATSQFPRRNRILAGVSQATVVIEAGEKSGALITARLAVDYGRDVFALPGQIDSPQASGTLSLVNQGAQLILGVEDLLQKLGFVNKPEPLDVAPPADLNCVEKQVFCELTQEPLGMEFLIEQTQLHTGELSAVLLLLELKGLVRQLPGLRYRLA